ncbi:MAG: hypothetical protein ACR2QW_07630 [bacterium]
MIHKALNSIPSRPVTFIVPLVVTLVLGFYYWTRNTECIARAELRTHFTQKIEESAQSNSTLNLVDITDFPWQQVKGFVNFKPQHQRTSCPFSWDWPGDDRQNIIDSGLLSVLIFFDAGSVSNYIEFRSDRIAIEEFEKSITRESARFDVNKDPGSNGIFRLTLLR